MKVAIVAKASFLLVSYFLGVWRRKDNKSPFYFENVWLKVERFGDLIKEWWQEYEFKSSTSVVLFNKMQALRKDLKKWNRKVFGNVLAKKEATLEMINNWDNIEKGQIPLRRGRRSQRLAMDDYDHLTI